MMISPGRSREIRAILESLRMRRGGMVLATLLATRGSSFRKAGAMALLQPDRILAGSISVGCLEQEIALIGERVLSTGRPEIFPFTLDDDADALFGYGLVCGGEGQVLIEPVTDVLQQAFLSLEEALAARRPGVLVRRCSVGSVGLPEIWNPGDSAHVDAALLEESLDSLRAIWHEEQWLLQPFTPEPRLFLYGATPLAQSLTRLAVELGYEVEIADWRRPKLEAMEDFPVRLVDDLSTCKIDSFTAAVILSHDFQRDQQAIAALAGMPLACLGVLGSSRRLSLMMEGLDIDDVRLSAPVGLDLGGDTSEEVALAILAEIQLEFCKGHDAPVRRRRDRSSDRSIK